MSYEIVYNRQFLRIDDKIIPLVLHGSNNTYELTSSGRYRRERTWSPMYFNHNKMIAATEIELMKFIETECCDGGYQEHFIRNNKWVDNKGLIRFFQNGIKNAKTIEEMWKEYHFYGMRGCFSVWEGMSNTIENIMEISSSEDLREFLFAIEKRLNNRLDNEEIYFNLMYYNEDLKPRIQKEKKAKERLTDYYAIKINSCDMYLIQVTSKRIRYHYLCNKTKQFKTEKEANKYIEKLKDRFTVNFEVEHIVE